MHSSDLEVFYYSTHQKYHDHAQGSCSKQCSNFRFDFCKTCTPSSCPNRVVVPDTVSCLEETTEVRQYTVSSQATHGGTAHGVVMWWSLDMDTTGRITLSTAPKWAHPHGQDAQVIILCVCVYVRLCLCVCVSVCISVCLSCCYSFGRPCSLSHVNIISNY